MFPSILRTASWSTVALCVFPLVSVAFFAFSGDLETVRSLAGSVMPRYLWTTIQLVLLVGIGVAVIGTATAWLVVMCDFPGRRVLEIVLALPFAFPAYVLAYAYTDLLDHPGFVQTTLRAVTGWGPRDYWFPEIRSLGGAALMLVLVLYPYVYLLVRASFMRQSQTAYQAARTLGHSSWSTFFRVSIPLARPAIAGGTILALMETVADFGTVAHFGVQTFATGIYQAWISVGDKAAASQLALCLLGVALTLVLIERLERRGRRHHDSGKKVEAIARHRLRGMRAMLATSACLLPVLGGFVIPLIVLGEMAHGSGQNPFSSRYLDFISNSLTIATLASVVIVSLAMLMGYFVRLYPSRLARFAKSVAGIGYAIPGGVIAVGVFIPLAAFDNMVDAWMRANFGVSTGLLISGSIVVLLIAYVVRFMAAALSAFDTGISQIKATTDGVARSLGATPGRLIGRIHLPLMKASIMTGLLIVFVDVMKELPATLILRPFNFDTLAVQAHRLASDERLAQAAVPSLIIVAFGLLPVVILCRSIAATRPVHHLDRPGRAGVARQITHEAATP